MKPGLNARFLISRIALAENLGAGRHDGTYADGVVIVSAVISGIAAALWPGGRDAARFAELWARYADASLSPNLVSAVLVAQYLHFKGEGDKALEKVDVRCAECAIRGRSSLLQVPPGFLDDAVVRGCDVDATVEDLALSTTLPRGWLRRWTYGPLFYKIFRSGYSHKFAPDALGDANPMTKTRASVLYTPQHIEAPASTTKGQEAEPYPYRRIYFDFEWLAEIARSIIRNVTPDFDKRDLSPPSTWWQDGG